MGPINHITGQGTRCTFYFTEEKNEIERLWISVLFLGNAKISMPSICDCFHVRKGEWVFVLKGEWSLYLKSLLIHSSTVFHDRCNEVAYNFQGNNI